MATARFLDQSYPDCGALLPDQFALFGSTSLIYSTSVAFFIRLTPDGSPALPVRLTVWSPLKLIEPATTIATLMLGSSPTKESWSFGKYSAPL